MDLEDALAATREQLATSREQNAQQQQLIGVLQQSLEAFQLTQHGLVEQIRSLTELLEQEQAASKEQRAASQARIAELEAMVSQMTGKIDALLVRLGEMEPPEKPEDTDEGDESEKPEAPEEPEEPEEPEASSSDGEKPTGGSNWSHPNHNPHNGKRGPPPHLKRVEVEVGVEGCCPHCKHDRLHKHSEQVSEAYDVVRPHLRVRRITREVRRCASCRKRVTAPMPPMPMQRTSCTFEMLAYLAYMKLVLFVPLDRLNRDFTAQGAPIGAAMLSRWFHECGQLLLAVSAQMRLELLAGDHLRFDATGLKLVDFTETGKRPVISGQVIVFCSEQLVLFHPTESKHGKHIEDFLTIDVDGESRPWQGTATADAVNIHDQIFRVEGRTESGCNAHGLRKFRDDADCAPLLAQQAMGFIGGWYKAEQEAKAAGLVGEALLAHRQAHAGPIAQRFRAWLDTFLSTTTLSKQNPVRKAAQYYQNHWTALTEFLRDPEVDLDNNLSERLLRNVALLRKNSLFSGTGDHVKRLCAMLSVLQTCRLLGLDPYAYLVWALPKLVTHPANRGRKTAELTPAAFKRLQAEPEGFG